jgi:hypothetical protein
MKKLFLILGVIIITSYVFTSCGAKDSKGRETKIVSDTVSKTDSNQSIIQKKTESEKTTEIPSLNVRLFFSERGSTDKPYEIKDFNKKKSYDYCYDVEEFDKLQIEGNAQHISIIVKTGTTIHLKQENIEIIEKRTYTPKDFDINEGSIIITQGNKVLFEGKIESHGCM